MTSWVMKVVVSADVDMKLSTVKVAKSRHHVTPLKIMLCSWHRCDCITFLPRLTTYLRHTNICWCHQNESCQPQTSPFGFPLNSCWQFFIRSTHAFMSRKFRMRLNETGNDHIGFFFFLAFDSHSFSSCPFLISSKCPVISHPASSSCPEVTSAICHLVTHMLTCCPSSH